MTLSRKVASTALAALVFTMSFGGVVTAQLMMADGQMSDCPFMGASGYCTMSIAEHLESWQALFATTLVGFHSLDLLPLLALALLAPLFFLVVRKRTQRPLHERWRTRELFDPLLRAFSRGRIHPKLYA